MVIQRPLKPLGAIKPSPAEKFLLRPDHRLAVLRVRSEAIVARALLYEIPAEAFSPVTSWILARFPERPHDGHILQIFGDIQMGFVERKGFDDRRVIGKNLTDLLCYGAVDLGPWLYDDQSGAFSRGRDRGHRGAQVEFARLMACRCDNATGSCSVYSQGFPLSPGLSRCPTDA